MRSRFLMVLILAFAAMPTVAEDKSSFRITTKRDNDHVDVMAEKDKTIFSVHSPIGISQAVIKRTGEVWPGSVVLRLHLMGLEKFQATSNNGKLEASVSGQDGNVRLWKDGKEDSPLDTKSPYWMDIQMVGSNGKPANDIPLKDGYFQLTLPKAFFENNPTAIEIGWIDFYRN